MIKESKPAYRKILKTLLEPVVDDANKLIYKVNARGRNLLNANRYAADSTSPSVRYTDLANSSAYQRLQKLKQMGLTPAQLADTNRNNLYSVYDYAPGRRTQLRSWLDGAVNKANSMGHNTLATTGPANSFNGNRLAESVAGVLAGDTMLARNFNPKLSSLTVLQARQPFVLGPDFSDVPFLEYGNRLAGNTTERLITRPAGWKDSPTVATPRVRSDKGLTVARPGQPWNPLERNMLTQLDPQTLRPLQKYDMPVDGSAVSNTVRSTPDAKKPGLFSWLKDIFKPSQPKKKNSKLEDLLAGPTENPRPSGMYHTLSNGAEQAGDVELLPYFETVTSLGTPESIAKAKGLYVRATDDVMKRLKEAGLPTDTTTLYALQGNDQGRLFHAARRSLLKPTVENLYPGQVDEATKTLQRINKTAPFEVTHNPHTDKRWLSASAPAVGPFYGGFEPTDKLVRVPVSMYTQLAREAGSDVPSLEWLKEVAGALEKTHRLM